MDPEDVVIGTDYLATLAGDNAARVTVLDGDADRDLFRAREAATGRVWTVCGEDLTAIDSDWPDYATAPVKGQAT